MFVGIRFPIQTVVGAFFTFAFVNWLTKMHVFNNFADTIFKFIKLNIYLRVIHACHQIRLRRRYHDAALTIGSAHCM